MRILLVNPPYISLTSAHGVGHQIPLGLLCIGGPLIDAGYTVRLLDAEWRHLTGAALADAIAAAEPDAVMTGHAGSTPAHPACLAVMAAARSRCPGAVTVYGGPYPTYHAADILARHAEVDVIVCAARARLSRSRWPLPWLPGAAWPMSPASRSGRTAKSHPRRPRPPSRT